MSLPLWKILFKLSQTRPAASLTCDECYIVLDFLADQAARGTDWPDLLQTARGHLARCPGCRAYYLQRLDELIVASTEKIPGTLPGEQDED